MHPALNVVDHRTAPMPRGPWVMLQRWRDLLFAHWELPPDQVRSLVPSELGLDLWEGKAYVAVTPFWMTGVRPRGVPPLLHTIPELNVRTYVNYRGIPGVYFFSLDAGSRLAVWGARTFYHLPYYFAQMKIEKRGDTFLYCSNRKQWPGPAEFRSRYWPTSPPRRWEKEGLEYFLTERYCLYTVLHGTVLRAYIHHLPWSLPECPS